MGANNVKLFCFDIKIDGRTFGGQMPAASLKEAQELVAKFGGSNRCELLEQYCERCLAVVEGSTPQAVDDFPEFIEN